MSASLIHTILFGAPTIPHPGRIIRFSIDHDEPMPHMEIRREIVSYLGTSGSAGAIEIANYLDVSRQAVRVQLQHLISAEVIKTDGQRNAPTYALVSYLRMR